MFRGIKLLLSSFFIIILSCKTNNELARHEYENYQFIKGIELNKKDGFQYSEKCYLFYSDNKFLAEELYKYNNGVLKEYIYCGPEGMDVRNYNLEKYSKDKFIYSYQKLYEYQNELKFNNKEYTILSKIKDTIVGKNNDETILVIINSPLTRAQCH